MFVEDVSYIDPYDHQPRERWAVHYTREERARLFIDGHGCHRRDGGQWKPVNGKVIHPDLFFWLMETIGNPEIVWECDRTYYPHETLPELPEGGGRRAWVERFKSYYDWNTGQVDWRWGHNNSWIDHKKSHGYFMFRSKGDATMFWLHASGWSA